MPAQSLNGFNFTVGWTGDGCQQFALGWLNEGGHDLFAVGWNRDNGCELFMVGWPHNPPAVDVPVPPDFTPEPVHPPGTQRVDARMRQAVREEEDLLLLVIRAFLLVRNRDR